MLLGVMSLVMMLGNGLVLGGVMSLIMMLTGSWAASGVVGCDITVSYDGESCLHVSSECDVMVCAALLALTGMRIRCVLHAALCSSAMDITCEAPG